MLIERISDYVLMIGWPLLVAGSVFIFIKGRHIYTLVKDSLVGRVTKSLVYTILVDVSSLGIISTMYIFSNREGVYVVLPVFVIWFLVFAWTLRTLTKAGKEAKKIIGYDS